MSYANLSSVPPHGSRRMTPQQENRMRILKEVIDRAFARTLANGKKKSVHKMTPWNNLNAPLSNSIDTLFTAISGKPRTPVTLGEVNQVHAHIIKECVAHLYSSTACSNYVERTILADLYKHGSEYELLAQMPKPRREYRPRRKLSLVEQRADRAVRKVAEWERKFRLAKTKLQKYRAKAKRYAKKGVNIDA